MAENFMSKLLNEHAERLEADHQKLKLVREQLRYIRGDELWETDGFWESNGVNIFLKLEYILGPDKSAK